MHPNFSTNFFHTCNAYIFISTIDFHNSIPLSWPWPCQGVTRSVRSKAYWFHFLAHFLSSQDEMWCGDEAIQA